MAFVIGNLTPVLHGTGGNTLWRYDSLTDDVDTVAGAGYFDQAYIDKILKDGDVVIVNPTTPPGGLVHITVAGAGDLTPAVILDAGT